MNSDQERELFQQWGWEYNFVQRQWEAPDGYAISTDTLVAAVNTFGKEVENALIDVIVEHGRKTNGK